MTDERRNFQRLNLTRAIKGRFGTDLVQVVDVSAQGALLLHEGVIEMGSHALLKFSWHDESVQIQAEVVRSDEGRSGVKFTEDSEALRRLLGASVLELLRAQEANAAGQRELNVIDGDETLTAAAGFRPMDIYLVYQLTDAGWKRRTSLQSDQPLAGFTVPASVPDEDVNLLCRTYESGDEESRRLTRLLAELSVGAHQSRPSSG